MSGQKTKELILKEAFKLFATRTYEQVTFTELENTTQLTRGAIMYHFKTKELIFKSMCDKYLLEDGSILNKLQSVDSDISLKDFIDIYIESVEEIKKATKSVGINNINKGLVNITNQATHYYPSFEIKALKWQIVQVQMWKDILLRAIKHDEIREDIDFEIASDLFEDIYCGISYSGIVYPDGIDVERLRKALYFIYNLIKY